MQQRFVLFAKIIGLLMVYWVLTDIGNLFLVVYSFLFEPKSIGTNTTMAIGYVVALVVKMSITLCLTWLILIQTEWVADKLGITHNDENDPNLLRNNSIPITGVKLIGLYIVAQDGPNLAQQLTDVVWAACYSIPFSLGGGVEWTYVLSRLVRVVGPALKLGVGLLFAFRSGKVAYIIQSRD